MIIGIGTDIVDIRRIARVLDRHGRRFLRKTFCDEEIELALRRKGRETACTLARRFAAKEAAAKALGSGFADGVAWTDICVASEDAGRPVLTLRGGAARRLARLLPEGCEARLHLSMSDDYPHAQAMVVIEARKTAG